MKDLDPDLESQGKDLRIRVHIKNVSDPEAIALIKSLKLLALSKVPLSHGTYLGSKYGTYIGMYPVPIKEKYLQYTIT